MSADRAIHTAATVPIEHKRDHRTLRFERKLAVRLATTQRAWPMLLVVLAAAATGLAMVWAVARCLEVV